MKKVLLIICAVFVLLVSTSCGASKSYIEMPTENSLIQQTKVL